MEVKNTKNRKNWIFYFQTRLWSLYDEQQPAAKLFMHMFRKQLWKTFWCIFKHLTTNSVHSSIEHAMFQKAVSPKCLHRFACVKGIAWSSQDEFILRAYPTAIAVLLVQWFSDPLVWHISLIFQVVSPKQLHRFAMCDGQIVGSWKEQSATGERLQLW